MPDFAKTVLALLLVLAGAACASSEPPSNLMGNTNWLSSCEEDDDCGDELSCVCGVCTRQCSETNDCAGLEGAACDEQSEALATACGSSVEMSVCLPECGNDRDCGGGYECIATHCLPTEVVAGDGDVATGCGPNGAFTAAILAPDEECVLSADSRKIPTGLYDVSSGFDGEGGSCDAPYVVAVLLYSCLQGINDTLQIHSAQVRLQDINRSTIAFDRFTPLPNPFLVTSNTAIFPMRDDGPSPGVAAVEIIPTVYAEQLDGFDGQQLLAEIQLFGTTVGDVDVELEPFVYPIRICNGCLTLCGAHLPPELSAEEIYGEGVCRDNASADDRICVDSSCTTPP